MGCYSLTTTTHHSNISLPSSGRQCTARLSARKILAAGETGPRDTTQYVIQPYMHWNIYQQIKKFSSYKFRNPRGVEKCVLIYIILLAYAQISSTKLILNLLRYIYTFRRDTHCSSTDCLLMLRCQLYMFRNVTVHPQELLFRCCMCRLRYVLIRPAGTPFEEERCTSGTYQIVRFLRHTIVCTYSI